MPSKQCCWRSNQYCIVACHTILQQSADHASALVQFTQKKTDGQIRWTVLNVVSLLKRHSKTHEKLAQAMAQGSSVAACIGIIEDGVESASHI